MNWWKIAITFSLAFAIGLGVGLKLGRRYELMTASFGSRGSIVPLVYRIDTFTGTVEQVAGVKNALTEILSDGD